MVGYYRLNEFGFKLAAGAHIVRRSDYTALSEANQILSEAEAASNKIRHQANEAYQREKRRGYEDGLREARIESVGQLLQESRDLDQGLQAIERDLSRLVVACVRKFIDGFDNVVRAEAFVQAAMKQMRREKAAELRVPTALYAHFREKIGAIASEFPEIKLVDVVEDSTLEPSRLILETSIGRVDGNIAQRLADLETVIRSAHAKATADALDSIAALGNTQSGAEP
jgi:type III secretion protein L